MVMGRADRVALPPQPTRPPPRQPPATQDIVLSCIAPDLGELRALEIKPVLRRGGLLFACVPDRVGEDRGVPLVCPPSMGFLAVFGTTEIREVPGFIDWSGRRGSNPRPRPWQGRALPLSYTRIREIGGDGSPATGRAMPNAARECNRPRGARGQARSTGHNCAIGPQISPKTAEPGSADCKLGRQAPIRAGTC